MFQGLLRRFSSSGFSPAFVPVPDGTGDCDIIIPVFNRPDEIRNLLASLSATTNRSLLRRIWIGDDKSDAFTSGTLDRLARESGLPVTVVRRDENLGFGANCNDLFAKSAAPRCIILNTDIRLPPFWMERMIAPFQADPSIVLATPLSTNAANHTVRLLPGQSWLDADRLLAARTPVFPDDCTAVGFCMAVNAELLREKKIPLFDPAFGRGYGEDTDLHYRVLSAGLRSVIVDNLLVHHEGEASFSTLPDYKDMRAKGEAAFRAKWADEHAKCLEEFRKKDALGPVRDPVTLSLRLREKPKHLDILFVLPTSIKRFGGIWFVFEIAHALVAAGFEVGIFTLQDKFAADAMSHGFCAFNDAEDMKARVTSVSCVVSTAQNTVRPALSLVRHYDSVDLLLLQGMEVVLRSGHSADTFLQYARIPNVFSVSECLTEYIRIINPTVNVKRLRLGPDPLVFYPREIDRIPFTVAISANMIPEKGTTQALEIALMLRSRGFRFTIFGWDTASFPVMPSLGEMYEDTSRQGLAKLFSRTEFFIDQSHLEGLGLLPLEAAYCGCIPILGSRGAAEYFFRDGENSLTINGYRNLATTLDRVRDLTRVDKERLRKNAEKLRVEFNLEIGLKDAVREFADLIRFTAPRVKTLGEYARPAA